MTAARSGIQASDIMSRRVVTVELDDRLLLVKELFEHRKIHHLMVVDQERLIGVLSDRDMFRALSPYVGTQSEAERDTATLNKRVHQVMSRHPLVATPDTDITDIAETFMAHEISCMPIVNQEGGPIGIITWRDVMKALLPTATLPEQSAPAPVDEPVGD